MVDLFDVVQRLYYSPFSKGKVGLKFVLPSIINDVPYLKTKYGTLGIYGKQLAIKSINFDDHQWINPAFNNDPYKTLPTIFEGYDRDELDEYFDDMDGIADGDVEFSHDLTNVDKAPKTYYISFEAGTKSYYVLVDMMNERSVIKDLSLVEGNKNCSCNQ
mgnify:CR=1 FL=1